MLKVVLRVAAAVIWGLILLDIMFFLGLGMLCYRIAGGMAKESGNKDGKRR